MEVLARADRIDDFIEDYLARLPYVELPESCRRQAGCLPLMGNASEIASWVRMGLTQRQPACRRALSIRNVIGTG